jgi:hypothetical protein
MRRPPALWHGVYAAVVPLQLLRVAAPLACRTIGEKIVDGAWMMRAAPVMLNRRLRHMLYLIAMWARADARSVCTTEAVRLARHHVNTARINA